MCHRDADFTDRFLGIAEAVRGLAADQALIGGKRGGAEAALVAFDLLRLDGDDLRQRPIET